MVLVLGTSACTMRNPAFGLDADESGSGAEVGEGDGDGDGETADGSGSTSDGTTGPDDTGSSTDATGSTDTAGSTTNGGTCTVTTEEFLPVFVDGTDAAWCGTTTLVGPIEIAEPGEWTIQPCGTCGTCQAAPVAIDFDFDPKWHPPDLGCARIAIDYLDPLGLNECRLTGVTVNADVTGDEKPDWMVARGTWHPPTTALGLSAEIVGPIDQCECTECCDDPLPGLYKIDLHGLDADPLPAKEGDTDVGASWGGVDMLFSVVASHIDLTCWPWPHFDWILRKKG